MDAFHRFTDEELNSYRPSSDWLDWVDDVPLACDTQKRIRQVEEVVPKN